jgi:hypothetical protein
METEFEVFVLKALMKLPGFSRFGLKYQVFFHKSLDLFFCRNFGDILSDINQRPVEFEFVIDKFRKNELNFRIELPDLQTLKVFGLELSDHICVVGNHGLKKPNSMHDVLIEGNFCFEGVLVEVVLELIFSKHDIVGDQVLPYIRSCYFLFSLR